MGAKKNAAAGNGLSKEDMERLRRLLLQRRSELVDDVTHLEGSSVAKTRQEAAGDLSVLPYHMADTASDNYEQELTLGLLQNEGEELREIDAALERMERGVYGICVDCSRHIPKKRLTAIPYATLCIECKQKQETEKNP
ncbi:MAG: TraR/DksA family transcriptional regulator [Planctomycetota bacterium]